MKEFNLEEINKLIEQKYWTKISIDYKLPEWFIDRYQDKLNWYCLSKYQKLSEKIIEKYKDRVNWDNISIYQKLSEEFIEKYQNKIHWPMISEFQKLSKEFIAKHIDNLNIFCLFFNKKIKLTKDFLKFLLFKTNSSFKKYIILEKLKEIENEKIQPERDK